MKKTTKSMILMLTALMAFALMTGCTSEPESGASAPAESSSASAGDAAVINFDSLPAGEQIDYADESWTVEKVNGTTVLAYVSADNAASPSNSLYLEDNDSSTKPYAYKVSDMGPAGEGSLSFFAYIPSSNAKTVYVNVGVNKNNSGRYVELRLGNTGKIAYEYGSDDQQVATVATDMWVFYKITWDADGTFDVYVEDDTTPVAADVPVYPEFAANFPTQVTVYAGDNGSTGTSVYIDDISSTLF
ncbi:MAG: hypothetical protein PQJ59_08260 [Spirochaetales bacterium]|nr:hypothetical protein [Spirochaetales bacterium]